MATYLRHNAWNNGGNFTNLDLFWYAKGVEKMMSRGLNDPASWWFYAAIHGEYVNPNTPWYPRPPAFPAWGYITAPPRVPTSPLPAPASLSLYWNQCQHGSWYFLPWHRGYLMALEVQLRTDIVSLGGPSTWALPYWDYFGGTNGNQYQMPPAFAARTLPDGSLNALYVSMRYGPDGNRNIYVPTPAGAAAHPGDPNFQYGIVTKDALKNNLFTGSNAVTPPPGFGGPETGFSHSGRAHGNFESNPHDLVHVYVGGQVSDTNYGLMADPGTAALDPIFYLHHCNIDRLWGVWNASGNANPTSAAWLNGPATRKFAMPTPNGQPWYYTPAQVQNLSNLNYSYQELQAQPVPHAPIVAKRLEMLGATEATAKATSEAAATAVPKQPELLGASAGPLTLTGKGAHTAVKLDATERQHTLKSFALAADHLPDKAFLKLENVRGTFDATALSIYVPTTGGKELLAGTVGLFGLRRASVPDGEHAGEGLTFILDITPIIDQLHLSNGLSGDTIPVDIVPNRPLPENTEIQVGRVSVYRQEF
jgi:tyrosinase